MTRLTRLHLSGWKSLKDATVELGALNLLIGANGSGKSNLLSFFKFLCTLVEGRADYFVGRAGGANTLLHFGVKTTQRLTAGLTLEGPDGSLAFETCLEHKLPDSLAVNAYPPDLAQPLNEGTIVNLNLQGNIVGWFRGNPGVAGEAIVNRFLKQVRLAHFHDTSVTTGARLSVYIGDNQVLREDAGNLAAVLYAYRHARPNVYRRILASVRQVAPFLDDLVLEPEKLNDNYLLLNWKSRWSDYVFGPHQFSDGMLRALALITVLHQPVEDLPSLLVIDEPELGLHPNGIAILASLLKKASHHCQLIVATQSTTLLDHFDLADIIVVNQRMGASSFERPDPEKFKEWLEDYGVSELWEKNVIGGGPF